jgi:hypothetical protein
VGPETSSDRIHSVSGILSSSIVLASMDNGQQTAIMKRELTASAVFSAMAVFGLLRVRFRMILFAINLLATGRVALDRVDDYLKNVHFLLLGAAPSCL